MGPRKFKRVTRKMVFSRYDSILKSCRIIENSYGVKRIPLDAFKIIIDNAYFEKSENENIQKFTRQFNKTLDSIWLFSNENSKLIGDNCISRKEVKQWIDALKAAFIKGQNEKNYQNDKEYN